MGFAQCNNTSDYTGDSIVRVSKFTSRYRACPCAETGEAWRTQWSTCSPGSTRTYTLSGYRNAPRRTTMTTCLPYFDSASRTRPHSQ